MNKYAEYKEAYKKLLKEANASEALKKALGGIDKGGEILKAIITNLPMAGTGALLGGTSGGFAALSESGGNTDAIIRGILGGAGGGAVGGLVYPKNMLGGKVPAALNPIIVAALGSMGYLSTRPEYGFSRDFRKYDISDRKGILS